DVASVRTAGLENDSRRLYVADHATAFDDADTLGRGHVAADRSRDHATIDLDIGRDHAASLDLQRAAQMNRAFDSAAHDEILIGLDRPVDPSPVGNQGLIPSHGASCAEWCEMSTEELPL